MAGLVRVSRAKQLGNGGGGMILSFKKKDGSPVLVRLKPISSAKPITIGREEGDIRLDDAKCSRIHSSIRYWDDIFVIRDMNSHNGTFVNGKKIDVAVLNPGDTIQVGEVVIDTLSEEGSRSDVTVII